MKRYSAFQAIFLSPFSTALYRDVARQWKGVAFGYLLLVLLLCWIALMIRLYLGFSSVVKNDLPTIIDQIPEIRIENGVASTTENRRHEISDPDTGEVFFIIDTTGAEPTLESLPESVKGVVTRTSATIEKNDIETRTFEFDQIQDFTLTHELINRWAGLVKNLLVPVLLPFALMGSFLYRVLQALFYSLFALLFAAMFGAVQRLPYAALLRITVVAMTPAILFKAVLWMAGVSIPFLWLICFGISMVCLFLGVKAAASAERESADSPPPMPGEY